MTTPLAKAQEWAGVLNTAGVRATCDPRDAQPPCVLFSPPDSVRMELGCGGNAEMRALLLVPGPGQQDAWAALERFLPVVLDALPVWPDELRTTTYQIDQTGPMPVYELSFTVAVDWSKP